MIYRTDMTDDYEKLRTRFDTLVEVNQLLMGHIDPDRMLTVILKCVNRLFSTSACSIGLLEDEGRKLVFTKAEGGASVVEFELDAGQGIAGWVAQHGEGIICNDVTKDPRFYGGFDQKTGFTTKSILCVPLKQQDQVIGVIENMNTGAQGGFTDDEFELLRAFAGLVATAIVRVKAFAKLQNANVLCHEGEEARYHFVTGTSPAIRDVLRILHATAKANTTVLLLGESGTGKEVMARALHEWSSRADQPFVTVNCTSLTAELLESDLFGHEKGAFTGAIALRKGKFELAHGGTLFLDELGELAPHLQVKLLRALQEREIQGVGGIKDIRVDVRIIAATNRSLSEDVQNGKFREDLYYRLNVVAATLPPLRERGDDISELIHHFLKLHSDEVKRPCMEVEPVAQKLLEAHSWPGNIRELQNVIERCVVLAPGPIITVNDLPPEIRGDIDSVLPLDIETQSVAEGLPLAKAVEQFKKHRLLRALERASGNQTEAARLLGLPQSNLSRMMKRLQLR